MRNKVAAFWIAISSFIITVDGAVTLLPDSEPTLQRFELRCVVNPGPISQLVTFKDPNSVVAGGCTSAGYCQSGFNNNITQDRSINTTFITIVDANIVDASSVVGQWECNHGSEVATLNVPQLLCESSLEIAKPTNSETVKTGYQVEFTHNCVCPNATYIVEYVPVNYPDETSVHDTNVKLTYSEASPTCKNNESHTITGNFDVSNNRPTTPSRIKVTAQIIGALTNNNPTALSDFKVEGKKIDQCVCAVTTILGGVLGVPFTILFDAVFIFGIYIAKDKDIIKKFKEKKVLTIMAVGIGVLVSCGLGAGVTAAVMSGKDTGYESTGCKCMKYIGVVVSLGFSILVSVVTSAIIYLFVFSRKDAGTVCDGRKSPEGKEANNSVNENEMLPTKTDEKPSVNENEMLPTKTDEKPSRQEDGNLQATPRDLPPIQKNESILATMPPRQLPLPPINHQVS